MPEPHPPEAVPTDETGAHGVQISVNQLLSPSASLNLGDAFRSSRYPVAELPAILMQAAHLALPLPAPSRRCAGPGNCPPRNAILLLSPPAQKPPRGRGRRQKHIFI